MKDITPIIKYTKDLRLLYVEDDKSVRETTHSILKKLDLS